jgi:hypothetical protein
MRYLLVAIGVALLVSATTALGGSTRIAQNQVRLGITNGVIHACVETGGGGATIGDIKLNHCHKGFKAIAWNIRGPKGARGASTPGPRGPQGVQGLQGPAGPAGPQGPPARTMLRLTGDFAGTNASVATSLDGVTFGPYSNGGNWGGSVVYDGADGHTLASLTQLSYTVMSSAASPNPNPIGAPYLRIFLAGDHDVIFDATQCATAVPDEDVFRTYEVVGSNVRYDDDGCDGLGDHNFPGSPAGQQSWASVLAHHSSEIIEGIGVTTGFTGGTDLTAILRSLSVNGQPFVLGQP